MKIRMCGVSFSYGEQQVLKGVQFEFDETQPTVLLGSSGRGKTTLLRLLAGLEKPQRGKITGIDESTRIAVMFQEDRLFPQLTVWENLTLVHTALRREAAEVMIERLNLEKEALDQLPAELSGGMRRRAALARALLFPAAVVLMDEPFQGLDPKTRRMALEAVRKGTKGRPLLLVSHEPADAEALGARAVKIDEICERQ